MPGFRWTPSRLNRLRSAVRSYNAAITRRERELDAEGRGYMKMFLPMRKTVKDVQERINTVNDFRRIVGYRNDAARGRTSELTRILKTVRPDALDFTYTQNGAITTRYAEREYRYDRAAVRRQAVRDRADMSRELYEGDTAVDFDAMSAPELATATTDNDLVDDESGEWDDTYTDVDAQTQEEWRQEDMRAKRHAVSVTSKYYTYIEIWQAPLNFHDLMPGYQQLLDDMEWIADHRPDVLNKAFNSGVDELDNWYITESGGTRNPYINIPYETRHNRAVAYVHRLYLNLLNQHDAEND